MQGDLRYPRETELGIGWVVIGPKPHTRNDRYTQIPPPLPQRPGDRCQDVSGRILAGSKRPNHQRSGRLVRRTLIGLLIGPVAESRLYRGEHDL